MDIKASYCTRLQNKIYKKTLARMRRGFCEGEERRRESFAELRIALLQNVFNVERIKVDRIIDRAEALVKAVQVRDRTNIATVMQKLLQSIALHTDVEITAHPEDMAHIKKIREKEYGYKAVRAVILQEDKNFDRGSLTIKANKSIIDAQVRTQLERAKAILLQHLESKHGHTH